jgi:phosphonate transport system substrate-binding protein
MIPTGQTRMIWKSPKLPSSPWAIHTDMPASLKADVRATLLALPTADPQAWKELTDGKNQGVQEITHADYEPIVRMIKDNQRACRDVKSN